MTFSTEPLTGLPVIDKGPVEVLDYTYDFTPFLAEISDTEVIDSCTVVADDNTAVTVSSVQKTNGNKSVSCKAAGGTNGRLERVRFRIITTPGAYTAESSILLRMKPK